MAQLLHDTEMELAGGDYIITAYVDSGTTTIQESIEGAAFRNIPNASFTADDKSEYKLGPCKLKVQIGGTGTCYIQKAESVQTGKF
jgi:hypothetical protein